MGISAIQSYHGAQVFEAVGLRQDLVDDYFTGTASRIGGIGIDVVAKEVLLRHGAAFAPRSAESEPPPAGGRYQWRADREPHPFHPPSIHPLPKTLRSGS